MAHHIESQVKHSIGYTFEPTVFSFSNMKPDFAPKLLVKKHYIEESFPFVVEEIADLIKTSSTDLLNKTKKRQFEAKLGVICHFLCDFFCVPHNQRWEFSHSMIPHVKYEVHLDSLIKNKSQINPMILPPIPDNSNLSISRFLYELLKEYELKQDYHRDMLYSANVCSAIIIFVLKEVFNTNIAS